MVKMTFNAFPLSVIAFLLLWVLTMIALPIVGWTLGETALREGMSLGVLMQFAAVIAALRAKWSWKRTLRALFLVMGVAFLAEWLGSTSGFPFGKYHYTPLLQPQLSGVPLLIPVAWMMMLPPAWAVAQTILGEKTHPGGWKATLLAALAFTAWDLFLDPQMTAWGFWIWEQPGAYFGIPLMNFGGWILVSGLITALVKPANLPSQPLVLIYALTWILQTIGLGIFWSQPAPALIGFGVMGLFVALVFRAWWSTTQAGKTLLAEQE